jgi:hypothetical protein
VCRSSTSKTTRSTIRPSHTRIAWSRSRPRVTSSLAFQCSVAHPPETSPTAYPHTPRGSDCHAMSSSRTTSSRTRFSAPRFTGRRSSPSTGIMTM